MQVEFAEGDQKLVLLPARFNKTIWIKKGNFLIVQQELEQSQSSQRIMGTIDAILDAQDIAELKKQSLW